MRRKETSPGRAGFVEELYTTRLDPDKLSEQQKKEAARIAAEIEEERNRKAGGRGAGGFAGARAPGRKFNWGEYEDDDLEPANDPGPPPPVHSATAFPALDSRPRESVQPIPPQEAPQPTNNAGPPVGASAIPQKQYQQAVPSMQTLPPQEAPVSYPITSNPPDSSAVNDAPPADAAPSNNAGMAMGKPAVPPGESAMVRPELLPPTHPPRPPKLVSLDA